ncbi:MAG: LptF/LptG family permease [Myxococcota bacterium]
MRALDRYLLREIAVPFLVGLGLFFVVVIFAQLLKVSDAVTGLGITGGEILQALAYTLPPLMGMLIPVSLFFATLLAVGRFASDREVIGMATGGVSPYRLLRVPAALGVILAMVSGFSLAVGEPWGIRGLKDLMAHSAQRALAAGVRIGEFNQWVPGVTFMASGEQNGELIDIVFADRRNEARPIVISARRGVIGTGARAQDMVFDLTDGTVLFSDPEAETYRVLHFEKSRYRLDVGGLVRKTGRTMTSAQAKSLPTLWRQSHDPKVGRSERARLTVTFHRKLAMPLATLIFALLAVPLAVRATGGARARGFLYSAGIVGAYYYVGRAAELAARGNRFDPVVAAWLPNLIGLAVVLILLYRLPRSAV